MATKLEKQESWVQFLKKEGFDRKNHCLHNIYVTEMKKLRELRKERYDSDGTILIKGDWDRCIVRIPLGDMPNRETAELFAEQMRIQYTWRDYDCTGQLFTRWQSVHYMGGQWWLWQCNCLDV